MVPNSFTRLMRRLRAGLRPEVLDRERDAEMAHHLDLEAAELARIHGLSREEARRQALVAFGGVSHYREAHRDARALRWLDDGMQDVRYALRALRRTPGFTAASVLILALGIGATTAVFSAVNAVLRDPRFDDLVVIFQQHSPTSRGTLSVVDLRAIEEQQRAFTDVGAMRMGGGSYRVRGEAEQVTTGAVTAGVFRALGIRPAWGRAFEPADDAMAAPAVTVLAHERAVRSFGTPDAAIGQSVTIEGMPHTVIGVLAPGDHFVAGGRADAWTALQLAPPTRRGPFGLRVVARLKPGTTLDAASRDLAGISERIFPLWASGFQNREARLKPYDMREIVTGPASRTLNLFAAAAGLVLLIAVANVASLMLVRAIGRGREVTLRAVLGASRRRIGRLMVTESLTLAVVGAIAGIGVGALGLKALTAAGLRMPHLMSAHLDLRAVAFAVLVSLVVALLIGAYPLVMLLARDASSAIQGGDRTIGAGRRTQVIRSGFVVAQFALALPLLAIAGLLLNSFLRLQQVNPGFDPRPVLTLNVSLPAATYSNDTLVAGYWTRVLARVAEVPGVSAVGLNGAMPPDDFGYGNNNNFDLIDHPVAPGAPQPYSAWPYADARYFEAIGVPLLEGRLFTPTDTGGAAPVVLVSRTWAARYFPEGNVVGRRLISGGCTECPLTTVIGVVGDVRYDGLGRPPEAVYGPLTEAWPRELNLFVRAATRPEDVADRVRAAMRSVDPSVPLDDMATMTERLERSVSQPRNWATMIGTFAVVALLLAAVGIFGTLSYSVSARRREIGVRMALGARRQAVVGMVVRHGVVLATGGAVVGMLAAVAATRSLEASLYEVSATDPTTLVLVTLMLLGVGALASWLPARRAAAIDPVDAMRVE